MFSVILKAVILKFAISKIAQSFMLKLKMAKASAEEQPF